MTDATMADKPQADPPDPMDRIPKTSAKSVFWFIFRILIAVAIIAYIVHGKGQEFIDNLREVYLGWLALATTIYVSHLFVSAFRWYILIRCQNIKIGLFETFSLNMQALFFGLAIPGGSIGGDLVKAGFIATRAGKGARLEGVFTILVDRIFGLLGLFSLAVAVGACCLDYVRDLTGAFRVLTLLIFLVCVVGLLGALFLFMHRTLERIPPVKFLIDFGDRLTKGMVSRLTCALDLYKKNWPSLILCFLLSLVGVHLALAFVVLCLARGLDIVGIPARLYMFAATFGNIVSLVPLTPSGVGTRDFVVKEILVSGGVPEGKAVAVHLTFTGMLILFNLTGGLFFVFDKFWRKRRVGSSA